MEFCEKGCNTIEKIHQKSAQSEQFEKKNGLLLFSTESYPRKIQNKFK
jgi:hypothetical protein